MLRSIPARPYAIDDTSVPNINYPQLVFNLHRDNERLRQQHNVDQLTIQTLTSNNQKTTTASPTASTASTTASTTSSTASTGLSSDAKLLADSKAAAADVYINELEANVKTLNAEIKTLRESGAKLLESKTTWQAQMEAKFKQDQQNIFKLTEELKVLSAKYDALEQEWREEKQWNDDEKQEIKEGAKKIAGLQSLLLERQNKVTEKDKEIERLSSELRECQSKAVIVPAGSNVTVSPLLAGELKRAKKYLIEDEQRERAIQGIRGASSGIEEDDTSASTDDISARIHTLTPDKVVERLMEKATIGNQTRRVHAKTLAENESLKQQMTDLKTALAELETSKKFVDHQYQTCKKDKAAESDRMLDLVGENHKLQAKNELLNKQLLTTNQFNKQLTSELNDVKQDCSTSASTLSTTRRELESRVNELNTARQSLTKLEQKMAKLESDHALLIENSTRNERSWSIEKKKVQEEIKRMTDAQHVREQDRVLIRKNLDSLQDQFNILYQSFYEAKPPAFASEAEEDRYNTCLDNVLSALSLPTNGAETKAPFMASMRRLTDLVLPA